MRKLLLPLLVLAGLAFSCKHQQKTAVTSDPGPSDFDNTTTVRKDAISASKASEEEMFVQGCIEKSLGNTRKALGEFQECLNMNPNNAAANYEIAGLYWEEGQKDRALRYAKTAADLNPANRWYQLRYAELLQENGRHDEATKIFQEISDKDPNNVDLMFRYANALTKAGKNDDALKVYSRIEAIEGNSDTLANSRITVYRNMNDAAGEEKALQSLIVSFPGELDNYYRLVDFYNTHNQPDKAADICRKMTTEFPYLVTPRLKLASYYQSSNQHEKAFAEAQKAFELPDALDEKAALVRAWYPANDSAPALTAVQKKETDSLCRTLRRVHAEKAEPYTLSADYLYRDGKLKEAREQYRKAVTIDEDNYEAWKRILFINDKMKDDASQLKDCKSVIELFPNQPEAYYYRGMILYAKKDYKTAIPDLESAMDYTYGNPQQDLKIKVLLIDAYRSSGNNEKADDYSEDVMAKDSSNLQIIAGYCASLADQHIKLYKASQMMNRVVEKDPNNASYLETLGWIEYQMGDFKLAKSWMEKALAKAPDNARMNERMGDIQFRLGNPDDALRYWKKAKEKGGTNPALDRKISTKTMLDTE